MSFATPAKDASVPSTPAKEDVYSAKKMHSMHSSHSWRMYIGAIAAIIFIGIAIYIIYCGCCDVYLTTTNVAIAALALSFAMVAIYDAYNCHKHMKKMKGAYTEVQV